MKKKLTPLRLNKQTISNLDAPEMQRQIGGDRTNTGGNCGCSGLCSLFGCTYQTCKGHTCKGNKCL